MNTWLYSACKHRRRKVKNIGGGEGRGAKVWNIGGGEGGGLEAILMRTHNIPSC